MACRVNYAGQVMYSLMVKTEVGQGCFLPIFLFMLAIDWITKNDYSKQKKWDQMDTLEPELCR